MGTDHSDISFLQSYVPATSVVSQVIDQLIRDLKSADYGENDFNEIILAMDEAVTNAVQATSDYGQKTGEDQDKPNITIHYTIGSTDFRATIIDHGKGFNLFDVLKNVPQNSSDDYHDMITTYATEKEQEKITIRINGEEIIPGGIGAGLKIILSFMDTIEIDFFDREKVVSQKISEATNGTILNVQRRRRDTHGKKTD